MSAQDLAIPTLPSRAIADTAAFYRQLGFEGGAHAQDAGYALLRRGDIELHFFHHPTLVPGECYAGAYLRVADVARLYAAWRAAALPARGIPRMEALEDKPWGLREFALVDVDGNLLRVGQIIQR